MSEYLIQAINLKKYFISGVGLLDRLFKTKAIVIRAVDGINLNIRSGEILALAGESGCGKTTTGKLLIRLLDPTDGRILFKGEDISRIPRKEFKPYRKLMQIVFQDPFESLNPRMRIKDLILEPARIHNIVSGRDEEYDLLVKTLEMVKLTPPEEFIYKYPHQLSGGQRQRVCIARAIITKPVFLVADEPVSMLDVSIRAGILNTLIELRKKLNLTILFITHDLAVAGYIAHRIAIMYLGKLVELADTKVIFKNSLHPYTQLLFSSIPSLKRRGVKSGIRIKGEPPSPANPPSGCRFHPRCPYARDICNREEPELIEVGKNHYVACHLYH